MLAASKGKVVAAIKSGKIKTACMMSGLTLVFFYDLPFSLFSISISNVLIMIATVLSIISGVEYYNKNKKFLSNSK